MKKSRMIAMLLAVVMVFSLIVIPGHVAADDQYTMYLVDADGNDSAVVEPGASITLYLAIENNPGITGVGAYIVYPESMTITDVWDLEPFSDDATTLYTPSEYYSARPYYVSWLMPYGTKTTRQDRVGKKLITTDADLLEITFTVAADVAPGEYEITLDVNSDTTIKNANLTSDVDDEGVMIPNGAHSIFNHSDNALVTVGFTVIIEGEEQPSEHTHSFTNYVSNNDATCEADGTKTAKCDGCDETNTVTDTGSAKGHSFTTYTPDGNATCEVDGTKTATCDHGCGKTETIADAGSAAGHSFTNYVSNNDATCEADGTKTAKCDHCDETNTITDSGSKLEHTFQGEWYWETEPTCTADGLCYQLCSCGAKSEAQVANGSKLDHSYTGTELTYKVSDATCCAKATYYYVCVNGCGDHGTETFEAGEYDASNHDGETEIRNAVAATEDAEGYTGDTYCLGCNTKIADGETIAKLDHTHVMTKHDAVSATCTTDGSIEYWSCDKCNKLYSDENGINEIALADTVIAAGHSFTNYVSNNDAKCGVDGTKTAKCDNCEETHTVADTGSALTHSYTNYVSNNDAACGKNGTETASCDHGCGATDTREIANTALTHSYTNYVSNNDAACGKNGTETASCDHGCGTTDTREIANSALTHSYTNYVSNNDAACEKNGTETASCDHGCGTTDTREIANTALTHSYTNYVSDGNATCTEDGTKTATCDHGCGSKDTVVDEGTALGHSYKDVTVDPTCTEDGYTGQECEHCGDLIVETTTEKLGHELIEHPAVDATEEAAGNIHYYECECCGKLYAADKTTEITLEDTLIEQLTPAPTEKPEGNGSPDTADRAQLAMMLAVMLVACMGLVAMVTVRRKYGN